MCDECYTIWINPEKLEVDDGLPFDDDHPVSSIDGFKIFGENTGWASRQMVESVGWIKHVTGETENCFGETVSLNKIFFNKNSAS